MCSCCDLGLGLERTTIDGCVSLVQMTFKTTQGQLHPTMYDLKMNILYMNFTDFFLGLRPAERTSTRTVDKQPSEVP